MVPLLKFFFHDEVRTAAADALPFLIDCTSFLSCLLTCHMFCILFNAQASILLHVCLAAMQNHRAGGADADGWLALAKNVWNHSCTGLLEVPINIPHTSSFFFFFFLDLAYFLHCSF